MEAMSETSQRSGWWQASDRKWYPPEQHPEYVPRPNPLVDPVVEACRHLPPAADDYLVTDYVSNLLLTVSDFQMHTTTVRRALEHYKANRSNEMRTFDDVKALLARYPETKDGNTALAQYLWGYKLWTRAEMLRGLVSYFDGVGVRDQNALRNWAARSTFKTDFEGRVKGLGFAAFKWLVMRQGVETAKPDGHVRRFVEKSTGNSNLNDAEVVAIVEEAALRLEIRADQLDWAIWEASRGASAGGDNRRAEARERDGATTNSQTDAPNNVPDGWYQDPFGIHEARYYADGIPTGHVADGGVSGYDLPPPPSTATPSGA